MISKTYDGRQLPSKATYSFEIILIAFYCFKRGFGNFQKVSRFSDFGDIFLAMERLQQQGELTKPRFIPSTSLPTVQNE